MTIEIGENIRGIQNDKNVIRTADAPKMNAGSPARWAQISAVITRANGQVEDVGVISYWHRNPVLNAWGNLKIKINEWKRARKSPGITETSRG